MNHTRSLTSTIKNLVGETFEKGRTFCTHCHHTLQQFLTIGKSPSKPYQNSLPKKYRRINKKHRRQIARVRTAGKRLRRERGREKKQMQAFHTFLQENQSQLLCPICRCNMVRPTLTPCHHSFCLGCIQKSMLNANRCPLCRQAISCHEEYGLMEAQGLARIIKQLDPDHEIYPQENSRFPPNLSVGGQVDAWMLYSRKWQHCTIVDIEQECITVEYKEKDGRQDQNFREVIELPSLRVAQARNFTKQQEPFLARFFWDGWENLRNGRRVIQTREPIPTFWNRPPALLRPLRNRELTIRMLQPDSLNQVEVPSPQRDSAFQVELPPSPVAGLADDSLEFLLPPSPQAEVSQLRVEQDRLPFLNPVELNPFEGSDGDEAQI